MKELTKKELEAYQAQERRYKNIEEWNKAILEAKGAEDLFNIALEQCTNEQERQELITKYLTETYSDAATQFKKTNKEVIASNKATEKWNKATAKVGKTVEPVITDIKKLGAVLVEDAEEPLEAVAEYTQKDVLPAIKSISKWVKSNVPTIKAGLVGVATAMVAVKVATVANTVAQKGLKGAIMATTVAEKALQLVQKASPWGLLLTGIVAVTGAVLAYCAATQKAQGPVDALTKEERELMAATDEATQAFRDQQKATEENISGILAESDHVSDLAAELQGLANASGAVKKKDQERAQFILNELNEALGTEYKMVDGVIVQYKDLKKSIDEVIQSKLANSLIEAANADYVAAIQNEADALDDVGRKRTDYEAQLERVKNMETEYASFYDSIMEQMKYADETTSYSLMQSLVKKEKALNTEKGLLADKEKAYNDATTTYGNYYNTIANYEEAQAAALSGNYEKVKDLLVKKGTAHGEYSDTVDEETAKVLDTLYKEAIDAGVEADRTKRNFENGVNGYTKQMVTEAEKAYKDALYKFSTAYADAEGVGEDLGAGLSGGMENKRSSLLTKARSLVTGIINAMRKEADSHSPARKTIDFGEDVGEGAEIGIDNKTKDVKRAATDQASAILDAYRAEEVNAQRALRSVAEQQTARHTSGQMSAATANLGILEEILGAIRDGKRIFIDGDTLVGATADKMDNALGRRRALTSRGAI